MYKTKENTLAFYAWTITIASVIIMHASLTGERNASVIIMHASLTGQRNASVIIMHASLTGERNASVIIMHASLTGERKKEEQEMLLCQLAGLL